MLNNLGRFLLLRRVPPWYKKHLWNTGKNTVFATNGSVDFDNM